MDKKIQELLEKLTMPERMKILEIEVSGLTGAVIALNNRLKKVESLRGKESV